MPRKLYRKRPRKSTPWYKRKYSTLQLAKKAWTATKYLKGLVNSERMYLDTTLSMGSFPAKSYVFPLHLISTGDISGTRTGNSILARSLYVRAYVNINPSVTLSSRVCLVLVKDKQQIADTAPGITDVFTSTDPEAQIKVGASNNVGGRFKILWRKNYTLIPGQHPTINIDKYWKLYDHIKYNGTAGTDIQKNGYYFMLLTSESTNFVSMNGNARLGYHDN